jgi:DNA-binding beta-propeller fold protein YncE
MSAPVRIAAMQDTRLLVSDFAAGAIHIIDHRSMAIERSFAVAGNPVAVAWGMDRIFVGNETEGRVEVYNPRGKLIGTMGVPGSIRLPNSIAVDGAGSRVFVLDAFEKVVKIFSIDGMLLGTLTAPGALSAPTAMTFDAARGLVLVSDFGAFADSTFSKQNARIHVFDLSGNLLMQFTGIVPGTTTRTFERPQGLALDAAGRLYVVDSYQSQVHVLDAASGVPLGKLGSFGSEPGQLSLPLDVCAVGTALYVTDNGNRRIATFPQWVTP